jgi:hypothetical protein
MLASSRPRISHEYTDKSCLTDVIRVFVAFIRGRLYLSFFNTDTCIPKGKQNVKHR